MGYQDDLNAFLSQNPGDAYHSRFSGEQVGEIAQNTAEQGDPLIQGGADPGTASPAPAYAGLTGDPLQTAMVTSAQLTALRPRARPRPKPRPQPIMPFAGLSSYLGA